MITTQDTIQAYAKDKRLKETLAKVHAVIEENNNKSVADYLKAALQVYYSHKTGIDNTSFDDVRGLPKNRREWFSKINQIANLNPTPKQFGEIIGMFIAENSDYDFGLFGNSYLYDCINAALTIYRVNNPEESETEIKGSEIEKNMYLHNRKMSKTVSAYVEDPSPRKIVPGEFEKTEKNPTKSILIKDFKDKKFDFKFPKQMMEVNYTLIDFILFSIKKYKDNHILEDHQELNEKEKQLIAFCQTNHDETSLQNEVNTIFKNANRSLKSYIDDAQREFITTRNDLKLIYEPIMVLERFLLTEKNKELIDTYRSRSTGISSPASLVSLSSTPLDQLDDHSQLVLYIYDLLSKIHEDKILYEKIELLNKVDPSKAEIGNLKKQRQNNLRELKGIFHILNKEKTFSNQLNEPENKPLKNALDTLTNLNKQEKEYTFWENLPATRVFHSRVWEPTDGKTPVGKNVVLLIHGLDDSTHTWETQARILAKQGYTVIAYDQVGHGFDPMQTLKKGLNLKLMQYDLYHQLNCLQANKKVKNIHLVGHSAGGALLCNSMETINSVSKIKSVTCIAPAIMKDPTLDSISSYPAVREKTGNKEQSVIETRGTALNGPGASVGFVDLIKHNLKKLSFEKKPPSTTNFLHYTSQAFENLTSLVSSSSTRVSWKIISGEDDKLVSAGNFRFLQKIKNAINIGIHLLKKIGHHPHAPGSSTGEYVGELICNHIKQSVTEDHAKINFSKIFELFEKDQKNGNIDELNTDHIFNSLRQLCIKLQERKEKLQLELARGKTKDSDIRNKLNESDEMKAFTDFIIKQRSLGHISFGTLVELNRVVHGEKPTKEISIIETAIDAYKGREEKKKKFFKIEAQTVKDLTALSQHSENMSDKKYCECDIKLIAQLRDARTSITFFREVNGYTSSLSLFNESKSVIQESKLTSVDQVIYSVARAK